MSADQSDSDVTAPVAKKPVQKGGFGRWLRRFLLLGFITIVLIAFFLPTIVCKILTQPSAMAWMNGQLPGNLKIGHAELGWQSPVYLKDVNIASKEGQQLASIDAVTSKISLWNLLTGNKNASIEFEVEGLHAAFVMKAPSLVLTDKSINVAELLRPILKEQIPEPNRNMLVTLKNSSLELKDESGETLSRWSPISGTYAFNKQQQPAHALQVEAQIEGENAGNSKITASAGKNSVVAEGGEMVSLILECDRQPTRALASALKSFLNPGQQLPEVNGSLQCVLSRGADVVSLQTNSDLKFASQDNTQILNTSLAAPDAIQLNIQTDYFAQDDTIRVQRLYAQTGDVLVDVAGNIEQCSGEAMCSILGKLQTPAKGIMEMLPEHIREHVTLEDVQLSSLSFEGPLNPSPEAKASGFNHFLVSTDLSWKHAEAYDIKSDNGSVKLIFKNNQAVLQPISVPVSGGFLRSLPTLDLSTSTPVVIVSEGLMLENVSFTETMCRGLLKYISPTMSNATSAAGQLSLFTTASQFPADAIEKADLGGVLKIHQAQIGPGPLSNGLLGFVVQLQTILGRNRLNNQQTWITMTNQDVPFRLVDGRVHHRDFAFMVGDMQLSSSGSVGLDDTLNLVVSMELPDKWLEGKQILANMKGEKLEIFVGGTSERPQIDSRAIAEFGKRMGVKAAGGLLDKLLNRDR